MKISNETKVGALTAIAITCLILGYNFLKGKNLFTSARTYYAIYDQIDGLTNSTAISLNGYKIGQVSDIDMIQPPVGEPKFIVTFSVKGNVIIRDSSIAKIYNSDLFGGKAVQLVLGNGPEEMTSGDTLLSAVEVSLAKSISSIISPVKDKSDKLVATLDSVIVTMQGIFNSKTQREMGSTIESLAATMKNLENTTEKVDNVMQAGRLDNIFAKLESIVTNFHNNNAVITKTLTNLQSVSDSVRAAGLADAIYSAKRSMDDINKIMAKINRGEGSLGMLINNDKLYKNLELSAGNLDKLLIDLKSNPKRYVHFSVFGGGKKQAAAPKKAAPKADTTKTN